MYEIKIQNLDNLIDKVNKNIEVIINNNKVKMFNLENSYIFNNPSVLYKYKEQQLNNIISKLEVLNPMNTIKRGYAIIKSEDKVITDINNIKKDDILNIEIKNGNIEAKVTKIGE